jgi:hypothetical protein
VSIEHIKIDQPSRPVADLPLLARLRVMRKRGGPCMSYNHITGVLAEEGVINPSTDRAWMRRELKTLYERATAGQGQRRA